MNAPYGPSTNARLPTGRCRRPALALLVACVSEDPDYATTTPPVTTVSLRPDLVGAEAVDLLIAVINGHSSVDRRRLVQPVLIPRRSSRRGAT